MESTILLSLSLRSHHRNLGGYVELQGHAIKNQDLLIASGTISLKGSEGMTAVDEDIEAAVCPCLRSAVYTDL
jgi:hypothetical protein